MVFPGTFNFDHHLIGELFSGASEGDGGFFGWASREDRDQMLSARFVTDRHQEEREASEKQHDTVHEALDEISEHLVVSRLDVLGVFPQFSAKNVWAR